MHWIRSGERRARSGLAGAEQRGRQRTAPHSRIRCALHRRVVPHSVACVLCVLPVLGLAWAARGAGTSRLRSRPTVTDDDRRCKRSGGMGGSTRAQGRSGGGVVVCAHATGAVRASLTASDRTRRANHNTAHHTRAHKRHTTHGEGEEPAGTQCAGKDSNDSNAGAMCSSRLSAGSRCWLPSLDPLL